MKIILLRMKKFTLMFITEKGRVNPIFLVFLKQKSSKSPLDMVLTKRFTISKKTEGVRKGC